MKSWLFSLCALLTFLISAEIARAESTYSRWLQTKKAAEQSIFDQQYNFARMLLEGISADVPQIGPLAIAEHAEMLSIALLELQKFPEAMATVMAGIDQMGPNPIGVRPRILLGLLLNVKGTIYFRMKNEDEALATAEQAREILEHAGGKYYLELYSTYELIGMIQIRKGNRLAAIEALKRALRAAERLDTRRIGQICDKRFVENSYSSDCVVNILITLGELSLREERFDDAMGYSKRAIKVAKGTTKNTASDAPLAWRFASELARRANNRKQFDLATSSLADALSKGGNFKPAIVQPLWNRFELEFRESSKIIPEATAARLVAVYGALNLDFADLGARAQKIANHDESRTSAVQAAFRKETAAKFPNSPKSLAALETGFSTKAAKETGASPSPAAAPQFQP